MYLDWAQNTLFSDRVKNASSFLSLLMLQVSGGDIFDFINIKLGGKRG